VDLDRSIINKLSIWSDIVKHNSLIDFGSRSISPTKKLTLFILRIFLVISFLIDWILILFCNSISFFWSLFRLSLLAFSLISFCLRFSEIICSLLEVATILRIPNACEPSEIILKAEIRLVFLTWVPPHNSYESLNFIVLTLSSYFSVNNPIAPFLIAVS